MLSYEARKRVAEDSVGDVAAAKLAKECTGTSRRRKRSICSLIDEGSFDIDKNLLKLLRTQLNLTL